MFAELWEKAAPASTHALFSPRAAARPLPRCSRTTLPSPGHCRGVIHPHLSGYIPHQDPQAGQEKSALSFSEPLCTSKILARDVTHLGQHPLTCLAPTSLGCSRSCPGHPSGATKIPGDAAAASARLPHSLTPRQDQAFCCHLLPLQSLLQPNCATAHTLPGNGLGQKMPVSASVEDDQWLLSLTQAPREQINGLLGLQTNK